MKRQLSHPLSGANPLTLLSVLLRNGPLPMASWPVIMAILGASLLRQPFSALEKAYVGFRRNAVAPVRAPIFIIGHWRSGTTHLYNVMSQSPQFATVSPFATALPWDFLLLARWMRGLLKKALPSDRFIDQIPVHEDSPQEDEIGLANMTPTSFYHALYFPRKFHRNFDAGLFFEGVEPHEVGEWRRLLRYYYLKLQLAFPERRLLIKNPVYTARVSLLTSMWPEAKFIHIHRNPYKVFFSMRNFYQKLFERFALQAWDHINLDEHILSTYERMMAEFDVDSKNLRSNQLIHMKFDDFQTDPVGELKHIYDRFDLSGFDQDKQAFQSYLKSIKGYKKNSYEFPLEDLEKVAQRWKPYIDRWGYEPPIEE